MEKKISFKNSKNEKLVGILSGPKGNDGPVVVLCHGSTTSKNSSSLFALSKILNKNNIATFRFDFFGHGESDGKFEDITISEIIDDVDQVIEFLEKSGYPKIGLFGSSFGASAVIFSAAKNPKVFCLALKSPVIDPKQFDLVKRSKQEFEKWRKTGKTIYDPTDPKKTKIKYAFFEDYQKYDGFKAVSNIKIPTTIVHGGSDPEVPVEDSILASRVFPNCELHVIQGADHRYTLKKHYNQMLHFLSDFIVKQSNK